MVFKSRTYRSIAVRRLTDFEDFTNHDLDAPLLSAAKRRLAKVTIIYMILGGLPVIVWATLPNEKGGNRSLPLIHWVPFNTTSSPQFEIVFMYQNVNAWFFFFFSAVYDLVLYDVCIHICMQLRILGRNVKTIRSDDWEKAQKKEMDNGNIVANTERRGDHCKNVEISDEELPGRLKKCINHHQIIIRLMI